MPAANNPILITKTQTQSLNKASERNYTNFINSNRIKHDAKKNFNFITNHGKFFIKPLNRYQLNHFQQLNLLTPYQLQRK